MKYLTGCAIVQDEIDLPEWVAYCFAIGFEHIHFYDNESAVPVAETLASWVGEGRVTVSPIYGAKQQMPAYKDFISGWREKSRWAAFIDPDEFILPHQTNDLRELLQGYEAFGGLSIPWCVYGSNGRIERPEGLVIESYTKRGPVMFSLRKDFVAPAIAPPQGKTIAQLSYARTMNPHRFAYRGNRFDVNENRVPMSRVMGCHKRRENLFSCEAVQVNHYIVKSLEDWSLKQERGDPYSPPRTNDELAFIESRCNEITDTRILRFAPAVRALMEKH